MRRTPLGLIAVLLGLLPTAVSGQVRSFPYEAAVETDGVPLHSGPGDQFYPTRKLSRGERVVVQRHDPGGWYMVQPPESEYGLIAANAVEIVAAGVGQVVVDEASVCVGSRISDRHDVEQIPLSRGDRVSVVEDVSVPDGFRAIRPPRGEYRWVRGQFVVPIQTQVRTQHDADPFAVPSAASRPEAFESPAESAPAKISTAIEPTQPKPAAKTIDYAAILRQLDRELEGLTLVEPTDWPLDALVREYDRLKAANPSAGRQIEVRIAQINRMRMVQNHYRDYVQLTSGTDLRDSELVARTELSLPPATAGPTLAAPADSLDPSRRDPSFAATSPGREARAELLPAVAGGPPFATGGRGAGTMPTNPDRASVTTSKALPVAQGPILLAAPAAEPSIDAAAKGAPDQIAAAMPSVAPVDGRPTPVAGANPQNAQSPRKFAAVGIVQRAVDPPTEAPKYVLVAPNGRILVYLSEQPGLPLDQFVGKPMGIDGERHRHPELSTPMIIVDRLTPVRF